MPSHSKNIDGRDAPNSPYTQLSKRIRCVMEQFGLIETVIEHGYGYAYTYGNLIQVEWRQYAHIATLQVAGFNKRSYHFLDNDNASYSEENSDIALDQLVCRFVTWDDAIEDLAKTIITQTNELEKQTSAVATQARYQAWRYNVAP